VPDLLRRRSSSLTLTATMGATTVTSATKREKQGDNELGFEGEVARGAFCAADLRAWPTDHDLGSAMPRWEWRFPAQAQVAAWAWGERRARLIAGWFWLLGSGVCLRTETTVTLMN
jgi:hypothetical protein